MAGGANRSQDAPYTRREHASRTRLVSPCNIEYAACSNIFVEQVQDLSRPAYPTPGPQAVAPQGFGATICFAGQSLGNIGGFNGLPVFSASGIEWIKARTGEEVTLDWYRTLPLQAPYNDELYEISPGPASARACIFAFVALSSFIAGAGTESTITYTDKFAQEVYDLLPEVISESVTLDGLQAILMLVSSSLLLQLLLPPA